MLRTDLRIANNGEEALEYLQRQGRYAEPGAAPRPDLILLDLNMPKRNGREVLKEIKADEELCRIPIVVLTTSEQEADIVQSYDLGCSSYIQKPVDIDQFIAVVRRLGNYWFEIVTLPSMEVAR